MRVIFLFVFAGLLGAYVALRLSLNEEVVFEKMPPVAGTKKSPNPIKVKKNPRPLVPQPKAPDSKVARVYRTVGPKMDWHKVDTFRDVGTGFETPFITQDGQAIVHGDILIGDEEDFKNKKKVVIKKPNIWTGGEVFYEIQAGLSNADAVLAAIDYMNEQTNAKFKKRTTEADYVEFIKGKKNCYSYLGKRGGRQTITLAKECHMGHILHEMMHTLGFFHEQNREDRDEHLKIFWGNIEEKFWPQFKKIQAKFKHTVDIPFDFKSLMLYPPQAFAKNPGFATMTTVAEELYTPNTVELSFWDKEKINAHYPP
ncbi:MAG: M12 family metallopeptidase [Bacteriovoracaceae bacterium]|nr:M12 family metallopeptidase [Bacteriovoracaceae bacterium]